jgi:hypothetical protein
VFGELPDGSFPMVRLQALLEVADPGQGPAGLQPDGQVDRLGPGQACLLQLPLLELGSGQEGGGHGPPAHVVGLVAGQRRPQVGICPVGLVEVEVAVAELAGQVRLVGVGDPVGVVRRVRAVERRLATLNACSQAPGSPR